MMRGWIPTKFVNKQGAIAPTKFVNKQGAIANLIFHGILDNSAFVCQFLKISSLNKQNTNHSI